MKQFFKLPLVYLWVLVQSALLALGQINTNKVRSTLTTIGIVIGVAAVTAIVAALDGVNATVRSEFETIGTNTIAIWPHSPRGGQGSKKIPYKKLRFMPEHFKGLSDHCPSVSHFTPITYSNKNVSFGERLEENVRVVGINPPWHKIQNRSVTMGRQFNLIDQAETWQVCLIAPEVRTALNLDRDCIGQSIAVDNRSFRIVGVIEEPESNFDLLAKGESDLMILIPFKTAWKLWQPNMTLMARSKSPELSKEAQAELRFFLRRGRNLKPGQPDNFRVQAVENVLEALDKVVGIITVVAVAIVGISLLVGGVGIMNIMLVSVSERTREIGLRKAVGAQPFAILLQFLVEAVILCLFGGLIGVGIGQIMALAITDIAESMLQIEMSTAYVPLWAIGLAFGFSTFVGIFFGIFPAAKAAKLDPIEALRHE